MKQLFNISSLKLSHLVQIVENIPEIVVVVDPEGFITYANTRGRENLEISGGYDKVRYGELLGCKYYDEQGSCGSSHYCDYCEIAHLVDDRSSGVTTIEVVRDVKVFDESVIKRFQISSFSLEGEELIALIIKTL